jgi:Uma2 family endonuclease
LAHSLRWKSSDLEAFPDDGKRYEIIDGELYVSRQPHTLHQATVASTIGILHAWNRKSGAGMVIDAPGLIFAEDDDVAPDVVWISHARLATALWPDGKLHAAPELVVEVLSPGPANERRDREAKLNLYSRRGVREYWIVNWERREVEVYRRSDAALRLVGVMAEDDTLESPTLPGFDGDVKELFVGLP